MPKMHYHITIASCTAEQLESIAKELKCKATTIDLVRGPKEQKDRMITKYGSSLHALKNKAAKDIEIIQSKGFKVVRLKIEEVVSKLDLHDLFSCRYLEGHLRVPQDFSTRLPWFQLSSNPSTTGTRFLNFRIRNVTDYVRVKDSWPYGIIDSQLEKVYFDSNEAHDSWWA
jgi:hypothetical protein